MVVDWEVGVIVTGEPFEDEVDAVREYAIYEVETVVLPSSMIVMST